MSALRTLILLPLLAVTLAFVGGPGEASAAPPTAGVALARGVLAAPSRASDPVLAFLPGSPPELSVGFAGKHGRYSPLPKFTRPGPVRGWGGLLIASRASRARAMTRAHNDFLQTLTTAKTGNLIAPSAVPPPLHARRHVTGNASSQRGF